MSDGWQIGPDIDRRIPVALTNWSSATVRSNWFRNGSVAAHDRDGTSSVHEYGNHLGLEAPEGWVPVGASAYPGHR